MKRKLRFTTRISASTALDISPFRIPEVSSKWQEMYNDLREEKLN